VLGSPQSGVAKLRVSTISRLAVAVTMLGGAATAAQGVARDEAARRCDTAEAPDACEAAGLGFLRDDGGPPDQVKARLYLEAACAGGMPVSCFELGRMWVEGRGGPRDPARAEELFAGACRRGDATVCYYLDRRWERGLPLPTGIDTALMMLIQACDAGYTKSCAVLGTMWQSGKHGVPRDLDRAAEVLAKACDAGSADSCAGSADLFHDAHDLPRAAMLYARACGLGHEPSCARQAELEARRAPPAPAESADGGAPFGLVVMALAFAVGLTGGIVTLYLRSRG